MNTPILDAIEGMARTFAEKTGTKPVRVTLHPDNLADLHAELRVVMGDRPDIGSVSDLRRRIEEGHVEIIGLRLELDSCTPVVTEGG